MNEAIKVVPLGVFGVLASQREFVRARGNVQSLVGGLDETLRETVASYLDSGAIVFAAMEHTQDIVGAAFGTPGGSGIRTDGTYYWRGDTSNYVRHYAVGLPDAFLRHCQSLGWATPSLSREDLLEIDHYLMKHIRRGIDAPLP